MSTPSPTQLTIYVRPDNEDHALYLVGEALTGVSVAKEEKKKEDPRYNPETHEAYCKYCYKTHRLWSRFYDVFPGEIVWECEVCLHRTRDEFMQIEGVAPSEEQEAFYRGYKHITLALSAPLIPAHIKDIADLVTIGVILGFVVRGEIDLGGRVINTMQ